jgi:hypothetical protein
MVAFSEENSMPRRTSVHVLVLLTFALAASRALTAQAFLGLQVSPEAPTVHDPIRITVAEFSGFDPEYHLEPTAGDRIVVRGDYDQFGGVPLPDGVWTETFTVGPLAAGTYTVEFHFNRGFQSPFVYRQTVTVSPPDPVLSLHDGQFQVLVNWQHGDEVGQGFAQALSRDTGTFWFFDPANVEVTLKVLDGRAVNGHFWVFLASLTAVDMTVTVLDVGDGSCLTLPVHPPACPSRSYHQAAGTNRNFLDTAAFPRPE